MTTSIPASEYRAMATKGKRRKYGNEPCVIDGHRFDSKAEARYYVYLKDRVKKDKIGGLELHRPFALIGPDGLLIATYVADFAFFDHTEGRFRVLDVKGGKATQTREFQIKRKLMKSFLGINVEVVES